MRKTPKEWYWNAFWGTVVLLYLLATSVNIGNIFLFFIVMLAIFEIFVIAGAKFATEQIIPNAVRWIILNPYTTLIVLVLLIILIKI